MPKNKDELGSAFKAVRTFGSLPPPRSGVPPPNPGKGARKGAPGAENGSLI